MSLKQIRLNEKILQWLWLWTDKNQELDDNLTKTHAKITKLDDYKHCNKKLSDENQLLRRQLTE